MIRPKLFLTILVISMCFPSCRRNPGNILRDAFSIDISQLEYEVLSFSDRWHLNGDGETLFVLFFPDGLPDDYIELMEQRGAKELPVPQDVQLFLSDEIRNSQNGLYILWDLSDPNSPVYWNYCLLMYSYDKKQLLYKVLCI